MGRKNALNNIFRGATHRSMGRKKHEKYFRGAAHRSMKLENGALHLEVRLKILNSTESSQLCCFYYYKNVL